MVSGSARKRKPTRDTIGGTMADAERIRKSREQAARRAALRWDLSLQKRRVRHGLDAGTYRLIDVNTGEVYASRLTLDEVERELREGRK
jgi:hypothetical protein